MKPSETFPSQKIINGQCEGAGFQIQQEEHD